VSWKLDRLGRSLRHLVELAGTLMEQHVGLKSLNDHIDTTTPQDRLTFNLFASLAEYAEPGIMQSRTAKVDVPKALYRQSTPHYRRSNKDLVTASRAVNQ